ITNYAQETLGEIIYIDLPELEITVEANTELTEIESTRTTSAVISPISGSVIEVNEDLAETPELINEDPHGKGWISVLEIEDKSELDDLMDFSEYEKYLEEVKLK
ncbi:MAG: glycine cleavage system protein H, partial [Nitrospirota bacterium]